ncbi:hypothetical protein [Streptomyces mexicanus]|uniref:hypothetical protein n=1 Tax=Streptomyces mexicanus TaxID=178566 RepID=UPI0031E8F423
MIGDLSDIPEFSGDLDQLEKDAGALKKAASDIRDTGRDVHNDFQGLTSCYTAPEADQLFHTTLPVRDKADAFADKLETVSGALSAFAKDARPLVQRMDQLRSEAAAFRKSIEGDDDWRKDQKNIDKNAHLVHEIGRVWGEFQELERATATKIDGQVGGTRWIPDDGSHKKGMYGFTADDAAKADDTPWGKVDEREYTGLAAAWHWTKDNVGGALKGFFVDGVWGTVKGLGHMVNVFDWDTFTKTWKGIGDVFGGVSAYIMTPYDWAMDKMFGPADHSDTDRQKKALRDFGKSLIAYDEWGTNPARAGGTVTFNVLTLGAGSFLKLGKAGSLGAKAGEAGEAASAAGRVAKVAGAFGKTGRLVDPMTYVAKGAGFAKLKVGDMMAGLKELHSGAADDFLHGADTPRTHTPVSVSDKSVHSRTAPSSTRTAPCSPRRASRTRTRSRSSPRPRSVPRGTSSRRRRTGPRRRTHRSMPVNRCRRTLATEPAQATPCRHTALMNHRRITQATAPAATRGTKPRIMAMAATELTAKGTLPITPTMTVPITPPARTLITGKWGIHRIPHTPCGRTMSRRTRRNPNSQLLPRNTVTSCWRLVTTFTTSRI